MQKKTKLYTEESLGIHRVIEPKSVLPQQANILDPSLPIRETEVLLEVDCLHVDSSSFHEISSRSSGDKEKIKKNILALIQNKGKLHNPVTGSGGMLLGTVIEKGKSVSNPNFQDIHVGDRVASLVSLTLTPLQIKEITSIDMLSAQIKVRGHAILFDTGNMEKIPSDMNEKLALSLLDVCGAPAQIAKLVEPDQSIFILGGGKSALLCAYVAKKIIHNTGKVVLMEYKENLCSFLKTLSFVDEVIQGDARDVISTTQSILKIFPEGADIVVNAVNVPGTEASSILSAKNNGMVYFFSMATKFSAATLAAEGVSASVSLMMGNGYSMGHAEYAFEIIRESEELRAAFEKSL